MIWPNIAIRRAMPGKRNCHLKTPPAWNDYLAVIGGLTKVADVPSWDEYFLAIGHVVKLKSKDPKCPVGAVIVSPDHLVLSTGYNGLARGVADDEQLLEDVPEKLKWICHAEENAILNAARAGASTRGCTIYVTKFPLLQCDRSSRNCANLYSRS